MRTPLHMCPTGEEALKFLRDPANDLPKFILLDINMPPINRIEFLMEAKADEALRRPPELCSLPPKIAVIDCRHLTFQ